MRDLYDQCLKVRSFKENNYFSNLKKIPIAKVISSNVYCYIYLAILENFYSKMIMKTCHHDEKEILIKVLGDFHKLFKSYYELLSKIGYTGNIKSLDEKENLSWSVDKFFNALNIIYNDYNFYDILIVLIGINFAMYESNTYFEKYFKKYKCDYYHQEKQICEEIINDLYYLMEDKKHFKNNTDEDKTKFLYLGHKIYNDFYNDLYEEFLKN